MNTKKTTMLLLLSACALPALAAGSEQQVRVWAASCAACHGTNGSSQGGIPSIAGVDKTRLQQQLLDFKHGKRPASVMHQHAKGYSDAELGQLADYFSRQK